MDRETGGRLRPRLLSTVRVAPLTDDDEVLSSVKDFDVLKTLVAQRGDDIAVEGKDLSGRERYVRKKEQRHG